jgi:hypothetical protein
MPYTELGADWSKVGTALEAAGKVAGDPYLKQVACEVLRVSKVEAGQDPGPPCPLTAPPGTVIPGGVGLRHAVWPIKVYGFHKRYPYVIPLAAVGVLGLIFYAGYATGKRRR